MLELCRNGAVMYYAKINSEYQTKKFEGEGLNFHSETWLNIFFVNWKNHFSLILSTFKLYQECGINPLSFEEGEAIRFHCSFFTILRFRDFPDKICSQYENPFKHNSR